MLSHVSKIIFIYSMSNCPDYGLLFEAGCTVLFSLVNPLTLRTDGNTGVRVYFCWPRIFIPPAQQQSNVALSFFKRPIGNTREIGLIQHGYSPKRVYMTVTLSSFETNHNHGPPEQGSQKSASSTLVRSSASTSATTTPAHTCACARPKDPSTYGSPIARRRPARK